MSSAVEMSALVREAADFASPSGNWKERVRAAARELHIPFGRAKRHYYQEARRVDAEEMDRARAAIDELRAAKRDRKAAEHLAWLQEQIDRHRASGEELRGPHIHALEHVLRAARDPGCAVEIPDEEPSDFTD